MTSSEPTYQEMQALVAFLPRLYAEGFKPVNRWHGGDRGQDGLYRMPYPEYDPLVEEFYRQVANDGWLDTGYDPQEAASVLKDDDLIKAASIPQIKAMLTFCVRWERFSDGHWAEMIENGNIRKLLTRIDELSCPAKPQVGSA